MTNQACSELWGGLSDGCKVLFRLRVAARIGRGDRVGWGVRGASGMVNYDSRVSRFLGFVGRKGEAATHNRDARARCQALTRAIDSAV